MPQVAGYLAIGDYIKAYRPLARWKAPLVLSNLSPACGASTSAILGYLVPDRWRGLSLANLCVTLGPARTIARVNSLVYIINRSPGRFYSPITLEAASAPPHRCVGTKRDYSSKRDRQQRTSGSFFCLVCTKPRRNRRRQRQGDATREAVISILLRDAADTPQRTSSNHGNHQEELQQLL
jgi:hypothetical protein